MLTLDEKFREDDLHALAKNWYPDSTLSGNTIRLTPETTLVFNDLEKAWEINAPTQRDSAPGLVVDDGFGLEAAFPDGSPIDEERDVLEFALGAVRRLGGALVTDTGHTLAPHPYMLPDLTVVSPYELSPEQALEVVRAIVPEARIAGDEDADTPTASPYALSLPIFPNAELEVRVERLEHDIPSISHVTWVQDGAVSYTVLYQPHDESSAASTNPDKAQLKQWREAYLGCSAIAKALHTAAGGFVLDIDDFLVDPESLF